MNEMEMLGFFMLGLFVGIFGATAVCASIDRDVAREGIFKNGGKIYKLTQIDPSKS